MATGRKIFKQAIKRSASGSSIETEQIINNVLPSAVDWSVDHEFISPNEICTNAVGLLFCLTTKGLINKSFTTLYHQSLKITWMNLLKRERRNLKPNIHSVEKCFMINRLIAECTKDPYAFARQTGELYEEIKMRLSSTVSTSQTLEDHLGQVRARQNLQCQRRLFHFNHNEANQPPSLLTLQRVATTLCSQLMNSYQINPITENYNHLQQLLQHSFIIIAQPSIPECVAATKYEKTANIYSAKLYTRIICLLDADLIEKHCTLSNVAVTLYLLDHELDMFGDSQKELEWQKRQIIDTEEILRSFFYVELESIELNKMDVKTLKPLYRSKLCYLEFQLKITINELNIDEDLTLRSQIFGLCTHAQYYPEYVTKVLLHEFKQIPQSSDSVIQLNILTNYISRYHTRISGVQPKPHTIQYIRNVLQTVYEENNLLQNINSLDIYEEILAKLISQMEMFIDHSFLSMMYHDSLFFGICNNILDQQLHGTREQPHVLLRFNSLLTHQRTHHASIRFIIHNGQLIRATFHTKAFVDEMCRMICEANSNVATKMQLLSETSSQTFHEFCLYFDNELFRLYPAASPLEDAYQPLIPVLWNTMRTNTDEQTRQTDQQLNSPSLNSESIAVDLYTSSKSQTQIDLSNIAVATDSSTISTGNVIIQTDLIVHHLVEKLSDLLTKSANDNDPSASVHIAKASRLLSTLTDRNNEQQKQLLSHLIQDYFESKTHADVATQTSSPKSND